jgi:hypothetical protein
MPELTPQSTPPIVAAIPEIDPARWEDFAVFHETFLGGKPSLRDHPRILPLLPQP